MTFVRIDRSAQLSTYNPTGDMSKPPTGEVVVGHGSALPLFDAVVATFRSMIRSVGLVVRGRLRMPRRNVGLVIHFADGTSAPVYRETVIVGDPPRTPCYLAIRFRLRAIRGVRWAHALFRAESVLNTLLFAGFPGLVSKLWLRDDEDHVYRGLYEWDGKELALRYANALWWVLALVSEPSSIEHALVPGFERDKFLSDPTAPESGTDARSQWWRPSFCGRFFEAEISTSREGAR